MMSIKIDWENNAELFWDTLHAAGKQAPGVLRALTGSDDEVHVPSGEAQAIRRWCEQQPGWRDGAYPLYAPHPLIFEEEDP